jgi:hypothetical protein
VTAKPVPPVEDEQPEVRVLRKKVRGEALTDEDRAVLERISRTAPRDAVPHAEVMRELEERKRQEALDPGGD